MFFFFKQEKAKGVGVPPVGSEKGNRGRVAEGGPAARNPRQNPVLLLDDVLSELDEGRKQYLLTRMKEKQTFVTSCDDTAFLKTDGEVYRMNGGVLSRA